MFRKTKTKIVMAIMLVLVLFLGGTLAMIYASSYVSLKKQNTEMLERYVSIYSLEKQPGEGVPDVLDYGGLPDEAPTEGDGAALFSDAALYRLSSFYSVALSQEGSVLAIDTGKNGIYGEGDILEKAGQILEKKRESGTIGKLLYRVDERDGYTLVAFMDNSVTENSMGKLLLNTLLFGAVAVVLLLFGALFLAERIVRPLERDDKKQKQFISDAGHELKTPISVISANAELLSRQLGRNEWLENIRYENERMGNLVRELLELSRSENAVVSMEELDLSELVQQEVLPFEGVAFEHGLLVESRIEEDIFVKGNRHQLGQLVSILMDNAISHGEDGKSVEVELRRERRSAVLLVRNEGEEIPEDVRKRLFDRFFRMDEAREDRSGHFGLGLSIAKAIALQHRGTIAMECPEGKIEMRFALPLEK